MLLSLPETTLQTASGCSKARMDELVVRIQSRVNNAEKSRAMPSLPLWHESVRGMPNHLARSSLFAPIARGERRMHEKSLLASRSDVRIYFWGLQLDEADSDVWLQAVQEARPTPLGTPILINRAAFLRALGRATGKKNYTWLNEAFTRLSLAMLAVETSKYSVGDWKKSSLLHLVDGFTHDYETGSYALRIDPRIITLFTNNEYALID